MGTVKLRMGENLRIKWPNKCAVCHNHPTDSSKTSITNTTKFSYYVVAMSFTHQTYTLSYPVCNKHKRICNLLDHPYGSSLLNNTFAFFIAVFIVWLITVFLLSGVLNLIGLKQISSDAVEGWSGWFAFLSIILLIVFGVLIKPVKIKNLSEQSMEIYIKDDKFLNEFKALNMENIVR